MNIYIFTGPATAEQSAVEEIVREVESLPRKTHQSWTHATRPCVGLQFTWDPISWRRKYTPEVCLGVRQTRSATSWGESPDGMRPAGRDPGSKESEYDRIRVPSAVMRAHGFVPMRELGG